MLAQLIHSNSQNLSESYPKYVILLSSDGLATGAILIEILEIFHKCLAIRVGNQSSDNISCLLTNINFSYGQKLHDSQIILQKF